MHHVESPPRPVVQRITEKTNIGTNHRATVGLNQSEIKKQGGNMSQELVKREDNQLEISAVEYALIKGDLSKLNDEERVIYYLKTCEKCGLNPYTKPFDYINLNGKLTLYAKKDATEQLRKLNGISIEKLESQIIDDLCIVKATARDKTGRTDTSTGAVTIGNLKGDAKANALMKAETKAKRRVTLSISGMGFIDESEVESIPGAKTMEIDLNSVEMKVEPRKISLEQAEDLKNILEECDPEYKKWVEERLLSVYKIKSISDLPVDAFDRMKLSAIKNMNATHAKQRVQIEQQSEEFIAVEAL